MKTSDIFNSTIGTIVDTYQGAVPLARLLLEAQRAEASPTLEIYTDTFGDTWLEVTFFDGSRVTLAVTEEM